MMQVNVQDHDAFNIVSKMGYRRELALHAVAAEGEVHAMSCANGDVVHKAETGRRVIIAMMSWRTHNDECAACRDLGIRRRLWLKRRTTRPDHGIDGLADGTNGALNGVHRTRAN
jgi:hypothetical protein